MKKILLRAYHLWQRIVKEGEAFPKRLKSFGIKVAWATFLDGLIPPGKSRKYIATIENFVDIYTAPLIDKYAKQCENMHFVDTKIVEEIIPVWCCWWQGEENMPEIVKMCNDRLKQTILEDCVKLYMITWDNLNDYIEFPAHIMQKYEAGLISMTALSDILRVMLLNKYGGFWIDSTVLITGDFPKEYISNNFYTHRVHGITEKWGREAGRGLWCGFLMAGSKGNPIFAYLQDAFIQWWNDFDMVIDYVILDYFLLSAYKKIPFFQKSIDSVPDNDVDMFEMYKVLNLPYSKDLMASLTKRTNLHKLTYKIDLKRTSEDGSETLYSHLLKCVNAHERF